MQHAAVGRAEAVLAAAAAQIGEGSLGRAGLVADVDILGPGVRPARAIVADGHAVVEADQVAAANRVQEEIVATEGLARVFASKLRVEAQRFLQRTIGVGVPVRQTG